MDLFQQRNAIYRNIVESINNGATSLQEIMEELKIDYKSGVFSEYLNDLADAGFISKYYSYNLKTGDISSIFKYRISDNYTVFYINYIAPRLHQIERGLLEDKDMTLWPGFNTIMGLQFENLVVNNCNRLYELLEIKPESVKFAGPYFQRATKISKGLQVDLLIATKDITYIVEVKFKRGSIGLDVIQELENKILNITRPKYMSYRTVLVHVNGISEELQDSCYFDYIVDFVRLL
jgi:hypothetical protein